MDENNKPLYMFAFAETVAVEEPKNLYSISYCH
jgi:hypothetical protein